MARKKISGSRKQVEVEGSSVRASVPEMEALSDNDSSSSAVDESESENESERKRNEKRKTENKDLSTTNTTSATTASSNHDDPTIAALHSLSELLNEPQNLLHTLLLPPNPTAITTNTDDDDDRIYNQQIHSLRRTSQTLFSRLEQLAHLLENIEKKQKGKSLAGNDDDHDDDDDYDEMDQEAQYPLSGLERLLVGSSSSTSGDGDNDNASDSNSDSDDDDDGIEMGAEMVWGQVDLQNDALISKVSRTIKKLSKTADRVGDDDDDACIRILDMQDIVSDAEGDAMSDADGSSESGGSGSDGNSSNDENESDGEEDDDDDDDEEARRIRERMERAMAAMEEDSDLDSSDDHDQDMQQSKQKDAEEEDAVDPAREELNDGFFDLHEMEDFADEEEDMLPNEAWGEPEPDADDDDGDDARMAEKKKSLPHLRGRAGRDGDQSDDDEEFKALEKRVETSQSNVTRKKYRDDDDVNALATLYDEVEDDDSDDDFVNMQAVDFFGQPRKPSREYTEKLKKAKEQNNIHKKKAGGVSIKDPDADEVDSWDNHDFEDEGADWREKPAGENESTDKEEEGHEDGGSGSSSDSDSDNDNDGDGDQSDADEDANDDDERNDQTNKKMSNHALRSKKLQEQTADYEKEMLAEKPWQMLGEASATKRPENSLLEVTPEFEFATKMAPIITQEHTVSIEEMIKQRILAEDWDDVIPRELPDIGLDKRKGELPEVSQEKSKLSLGELYEREYLKKAAGYDKDAVEKETEEEKAKNEMKMLFANLCSKLDALSNYHFAPRPVADEADVKTTSTPAIAMEEVLPLHVSDAKAMAPEEIFNKKKGRDGILRGESEMDQTDRKRLRQSKKAARRKARKAKLADEKLISRLKPELGLNNPYEKRKMREELQMARASGKVVQGEVESNADFKTSAKFFQRMQSDVQKLLHDDEGGANDKKRKRYSEDSAKSSKFKL